MVAIHRFKVNKNRPFIWISLVIFIVLQSIRSLPLESNKMNDIRVNKIQVNIK